MHLPDREQQVLFRRQRASTAAACQTFNMPVHKQPKRRANADVLHTVSIHIYMAHCAVQCSSAGVCRGHPPIMTGGRCTRRQQCGVSMASTSMEQGSCAAKIASDTGAHMATDHTAVCSAMACMQEAQRMDTAPKKPGQAPTQDAAQRCATTSSVQMVCTGSTCRIRMQDDNGHANSSSAQHHVSRLQAWQCTARMASANNDYLHQQGE